MVYSMPAQPPFFTPMRTPSISLPEAAESARRRSAAASVRLITCGRGLVMASSWGNSPAHSRATSEHVEGKPRLVGHAGHVPGRIEHEFHLHLAHAGDRSDRVLHPDRNVSGNRAAGRRQRHVDLDVAVVIDIQPIDEAELVNIDGDFRIEDGLQGGDQVGLQPFQFLRRNGGNRSLPAAGRTDARLDLPGLAGLSLGLGLAFLFLGLLNHLGHDLKRTSRALCAAPRPGYRLLQRYYTWRMRPGMSR